MGKYKASIGIWEHKITGNDGKDIIFKIVPEEGDNIKFVDIKKKAEKAKDELVLTKGIADLYFEMIARSDKTLTDEDKDELKTLISMNINKITTDLLIQFKWTTQKKLDDMENRQWKVQEEIQKKKMMMEFEEEKKEKEMSKKKS